MVKSQQKEQVSQTISHIPVIDWVIEKSVIALLRGKYVLKKLIR